jgi:HEAT repeat protein
VKLEAGKQMQRGNGTHTGQNFQPFYVEQSVSEQRRKNLLSYLLANLKLTGTNSYAVRRSATHDLGFLDDPALVSYLLPILNDNNELDEVKSEALRSLGRLGGIEVAEILTRFTTAKTVLLRSGAIGGLALLTERFPEQARAYHEYFVRALYDRNGPIADAARALGASGNPDALEPLLDLLKRENAYFNMRAVAAESLGRLGNRDALPALQALAYKSDESEMLRERAKEAIRRLEGTPEPPAPAPKFKLSLFRRKVNFSDLGVADRLEIRDDSDKLVGATLDNDKIKTVVYFFQRRTEGWRTAQPPVAGVRLGIYLFAAERFLLRVGVGEEFLLMGDQTYRALKTDERAFLSQILELI